MITDETRSGAAAEGVGDPFGHGISTGTGNLGTEYLSLDVWEGH